MGIMRFEQAVAEVKLKYGDKFIEVKALVDTSASKSIISKRLTDMLGAFIPLKSHMSLRQQMRREG